MRSFFFSSYLNDFSHWRKVEYRAISAITKKWKGIVISKKVEGNSNQNGRK